MADRLGGQGMLVENTEDVLKDCLSSYAESLNLYFGDLDRDI
ncbi:hypothetical protein PRBEI_2001850700 [Prionailurus iriomotensis]